MLCLSTLRGIRDQCFCCHFNFCVKRSHSWKLLQTTQRCVNASFALECYDWLRAIEFWISTALDWPGVDVLHHCVLNSYVLIPVIFSLRSHTASFWKFTGNVTTSHTGKLPERIYWYFWKGPAHTWSFLYGNLLVIFQ